MTAQSAQESQEDVSRPHLPQIGRPAPDFELDNQFGEPIRLSSLRGAPVVIVFYPFAFSRVCTSELCDLRDNLDPNTPQGVRLLGVSVDHKYTLRAYAEQERYTFDLLADFWPHGQTARAYGVFDPDKGRADRATFVLDAQGVLRSIIRSEGSQQRDLRDYREALEALAGKG